MRNHRETISSRRRSQPLFEALFSACLCLYPPPFRADYAGAMAEVFSARLRDLRGRPFSSLHVLLRECFSAASWGLALRLSNLFRRGRRGRFGTGTGAYRRGSLPTRRPSLPDRGWDLLLNATRDLRHAARSLARRPTGTIGAILALGLGIGLSTTIFSVVYGTAYRPLPVPEGDRIVHLDQADPARGRREIPVGYHDFQDWRGQQTVFNDLAAFYQGTVNLSGNAARPERYFGAFVTANTWKVLGVQPALGRGFVEGEDRPGAPPVVIIAHSVWDVRFNRDPEIVGQSVRVNGEPSTIVGVMPEGFGFPYWEAVWIPMKVDPLAVDRGGEPGLEVFGRLKEGVTLEEARTEFRGISARLAAEFPETNQGIVASVDGYVDAYRGDGGMQAAHFLLGFGLSVLLIACFNVTNLLLAQAVTQLREMAVRVALGASRWRVVAQVLHQAFLLASVGAVVGILLATAALGAVNRWITAAATSPLPFWMDVTLGGPALLFVLGAVGVSVLAAGLFPALRASRTDVYGTLTDASRGNSSLRIGRLSRFLVFSQITLTAMLLILAGHLALQVSQTRAAEHPYPTHDVLTARVALFEAVFPERADRHEFFRELVRRLENHPGVEAATLCTALPGTQTEATRVAIQPEAYAGPEEMPLARVAHVSPGFFGAFEATATEGRTFTDADDGLPVALVNEPFVGRFFPGDDPVGRQIRVGWPEPEGSWRTIVGVVPDLDMGGTAEEARNPWGVYLPLAQADVRSVSIAVRTRGDPMAFAPALRDEVMALQRDTPIYFVQTLHHAINTSLQDVVLVGSLLWSLALAAFLLASVGLYGVTAFLSTQRTRELGVRIALGAKAVDVLKLVVRQGSTQILLGLVLGLLLARGSMVVLSQGGSDTIPWSFGVAAGACVVLCVAGLLAVFTPAWRATKVDPVEALRAE